MFNTRISLTNISSKLFSTEVLVRVICNAKLGLHLAEKVVNY